MADAKPYLTPRMIGLGFLPLIIAAVIVLARRPDDAVERGPAQPAVASTSDGRAGALHFEPVGPPLPNWTQLRGVIQPDTPVGKSLEEFGVKASQVAAIDTVLRPHFDLRRVRPGQTFDLRIEHGTGKILLFRFNAGPLDVFEAVRQETGLAGRRVEVPVKVVEAAVGVEIQSSLYRSIQRAGESGSLVSGVVDVFAWDLDFFRDCHPGDQFRIIVEKVYKYDEFIRYGRIIGAEYRGKVGVFRTFWFTPGGNQPEGYYLADGRSARKTFLATPLRFKRISSKFNPKRKHPILGYTKAHTGVDYAASRGTPVWAMASGRVVFAGRKGANGNLVTIDHGNGLRSYYAHLHRIARGIRKGAKIRQKQTLGSVGSTGRATGPHLHFAVRRNGKWVNPARLKMSRGRGVAKKSRAAFEKLVDERMVQLRQIRVDTAPPRPPPRQPATP